VGNIVRPDKLSELKESVEATEKLCEEEAVIM
jgi:hypothetical protein